MNAGQRPAHRRSTLPDVLVAILAGVLALGVYVRSLAPGLLWGDSAEFQMAAWLGGIAHPTGYPLYLLLGWLWTHLVPFRDPAFRMNLFSALWGAIAIALFALFVMRLIRFVSGANPAGTSSADPASRVPVWVSRLIAFAAALALTFTPTFWSQAVITEVYTLHAAFVAGLLLVLVNWADRYMAGDAAGARRRAYLVALLFGLSLTHHRSTILLIPAAALFIAIVLASTGSRLRFSTRRIGLLLLCLAAPLLLYLYIPLRAPHVPYYRLPLAPGQFLQLYDSSLAGFLAHISGSVFSSSLVAQRLGDLDLARLPGRFVEELSFNGVLLGSLGLAALLLLSILERSFRSLAVLALTGVFIITQVAFNLFYAIGDIFVFYIPAYLVWVVWMAVGACGLVLLGAWLFASLGKRSRPWAVAGGAVLAGAVLVAFAYRSAIIFWPKVQAATENSARTDWDALLESDLPQRAVLVSNDRDEMVPLWYLTYVEGRRPDLTGLFPLIQPGPAWSDIARVTDSALQTGRPVALVKPMPGLEIKYGMAPTAGGQAGKLGPAVRVTPLASPSPAHSGNAVYGETMRLDGYNVAPEPLRAGQEAAITVYWEPLRRTSEDLTSFIQLVSPTGGKVGQSDHRPGGMYYPTSLWPVGERAQDVHRLSVTPGAPPGTYQIVAGMYKQVGNSLQQLGEPQVIGDVTVSP